MIVFFHVIGNFLYLLALAIFLRAVLSWLPISANNVLAVLLYQVTEPVLSPLRSVMPRIGMLDITPMVAIILLLFLSSALTSL